jgi:hypothetical protein
LHGSSDACACVGCAVGTVSSEAAAGVESVSARASSVESVGVASGRPPSVTDGSVSEPSAGAVASDGVAEDDMNVENIAGSVPPIFALLVRRLALLCMASRLAASPPSEPETPELAVAVATTENVNVADAAEGEFVRVSEARTEEGARDAEGTDRERVEVAAVGVRAREGWPPSLTLRCGAE